jgi:D-threo-aldose 1-dehydrogenase
MDIRNFTARNGSALAFSVVGFGTAPLGDLYTKLDETTSIATVNAAYQSGVTIFDTSPHYGNGLAEARVGSGLRHADRSKVMISTKVGRVMDPWTKPEAPRADVVSPGFAGGLPHRAHFDYSRDGTMRSIEQSLLRLGVDHLDIVLIHDCDIWTHGEAAAPVRFKEAMDGAYAALAELRSQKVVRAIGVGVNESATATRFVRAGDFDVTMLAGRYSLLAQDALDEFLPAALERKMGIMLAGVFNSGILATGAISGARFNYGVASPEIMDRVKGIDAVCRAHGVSLRQAALQFSMAHPAVVSVVLGGVTPEEVRANAADASFRVPSGLWSDLKSAGYLNPAAPTPTA